MTVSSEPANYFAPRQKLQACLVTGALRFTGRGAGNYFSLLLERKRFGSRLFVPRRLLDGRRCATARRHLVASLDGRRELRIWRAAIYFLPAGVLDVRRIPEFRNPLGVRAGGIHRFNSNLGGFVGICIGPPLVSREWRAFLCGLFCGQPLRAAHRVQPQRFCGAARAGFLSSSDSGRIAIGGRGAKPLQRSARSRRVPGHCLCRRVADQRTRRGDRQLRPGGPVRMAGPESKILAATAAWRRGTGAWALGSRASTWCRRPTSKAG